MKALIFSLIALLATACQPSISPPVSCSDSACSKPVRPLASVEQALKSTVLVTGKEPGWICAGVFVSPGLVLTAHHCVASDAAPGDERSFVGNELLVLTYANFKAAGGVAKRADAMLASVVRDDAKNDLSLLATEERSSTWVTVADTAPVMGNTVFTIGHPVGIMYSLAYGHIAHEARRLRDWTQLFVQVDMGAYGGNSGGGLFTMNGELVGICSIGSKAYPTLQFFVHLDPIRKIVDSAR